MFSHLQHFICFDDSFSTNTLSWQLETIKGKKTQLPHFMGVKVGPHHPIRDIMFDNPKHSGSARAGTAFPFFTKLLKICAYATGFSGYF